MTSCFGPQASPMMTAASNVGEGYRGWWKTLCDEHAVGKGAG